MKKEKLIEVCSKKELKNFIEMAKNEIIEWWNFIDICKEKLNKDETKKQQKIPKCLKRGKKVSKKKN